MKALKICLLSCLLIFAVSCEKDDSSDETAVFAVPVIKTLAEIRSSVSVSGAEETDADGKIYVAENYLFYIAKEQGVHVFDNANPSAPQNVAFINLQGVHDIAIKGDFLYADNFVDLLVFDISDMQNIELVQTLPNSIVFYPSLPETAEYYDYNDYPEDGEIVTGFTLETRERPDYPNTDIFSPEAVSDGGFNGSESIGTGGSYAKFQINNNALYTVDSYQLNVFNITDPEAIFFDKAVQMSMWFGSGEFETLFKQKDYLFVGATNGMHVVDASDEFNPYFLSGFSHATACDPVVVFLNTAYITVRGGTTCGAIEDQVNVIDISDITNPTLISTYLLNQPQGLGYHNNALYIGCGNDGLKVFDASNSAALQLENSYAGFVTDVIPLNSHLIAVGNNKIIQYNYGPNFTLDQISVLNF